ncbi:hypothetical protein SLEP1_g47526 [Rubroshorea leprosula]|uniref:Uncharacterized protein n=1 Tax=Rubroshorea leprosula TaxID=152421 RepID=A0AAV5LRN7_9ROSI|nr:hypothetical protein SLEP1_g47526 [Rubroshorea leprosula]
MECISNCGLCITDTVISCKGYKAKLCFSTLLFKLLGVHKLHSWSWTFI